MRRSLDYADIGVQDMAEYLGVGRNSAGNWINGRRTPNTQTLRLWAMRCGVSFEWLRDGDEVAERVSGDLLRDLVAEEVRLAVRHQGLEPRTR